MYKGIISGGGTGGHIIPAINLAKALSEKGVEILYIGNVQSMEEEIANKQGINFKSVNVQKLYRSLTPKHLLFPLKLAKSIYTASQIINEYKPDFFLGTGGFVSGPVAFASILRKIPVFLQEQNSYPGITTRLLAKKAQQIFLGMESANKKLPLKKTIFTGNPVNISSLNSFTDKNIKSDFTILILGGSQGSLFINNQILPIIDTLLAREIRVLWQCGEKNLFHLQSVLNRKEGVEIFGFSDKIHEYYHQADLIVARAGALTIADIECHKKPAIFIPLPSAAANHQYFNAKEKVEKGVAEILPQDKSTPTKLLDLIIEMKQNIKKYKYDYEIKHLTACDQISQIILNFLSKKDNYAGN